MKRLLLVLGILAVVACATFWPRATVWTVYAQTLPITKTVAWDANPAGDGVLSYTVQLDGVTVGSPTVTTQTVTFTTAGAHVLRVSATNQWGVSGYTTLTVNVVVPANPANLRLQ
jgi:hypothetical protein